MITVQPPFLAICSCGRALTGFTRDIAACQRDAVVMYNVSPP
jgi:hypothetical protein